MRLEELDFSFPEELIAQHPAEPRDSCRLLAVDRATGRLGHRVFRELPELLRPGDLLVLNDSRVLPARLFAHKESGGRVELLFLHELEPDPGSPDAEGGSAAENWEVLARPSARLSEGTLLLADGAEESGRLPGAGRPADPGVRLQMLERLGEGRWRLGLPAGLEGVDLLERLGRPPLPPYIKADLRRDTDYQTVFAAVPGSTAAPTAGLHFTPALLRQLSAAGIENARVTLHVGLDTFRPVTAPRVEDHVIHREYYTVSPDQLALLERARGEGRRLVAVGTTSVRVLETLYGEGQPDGGKGGTTAPGDGVAAGDAKRGRGHTSIFITPGHRFRAVDALITNFHLPRTSLLALVMAFAGVELTRQAYRTAVEERYRFFSFGDAMLIQDECGR